MTGSMNWDRARRDRSRSRALPPRPVPSAPSTDYFIATPTAPALCDVCVHEADVIALRPSDLRTLCLDCANRAGVVPIEP